MRQQIVILMITDKQKVIIIESELDRHVPTYSEISRKIPMSGVKWLIMDRKYCVQYIMFDTVHEACTAATNNQNEKILANCAKGTKLEDIILPINVTKMSFTNDNHEFVCYLYNNEEYFDIHHIIHTLNDMYNVDVLKYKKWVHHVTRYLRIKNKYFGHVQRELINKESVYQMIFQCKPIQYQTNRLSMSRSISTLRGKEVDDNSTIITQACPNNIIPYKYSEPDHLAYVQDLVATGSRYPYLKYINQNIMYACILIFIHSKNSKIILKFGYSANIIQRFRCLEKEYNCIIFLISVRIVSHLCDELRFHKFIKNKYKTLIAPYTIESTEKNELYYLNPALIKEFNEYLPEYQTLEPLTNKPNNRSGEFIKGINERNKIFIDITTPTI